MSDADKKASADIRRELRDGTPNTPERIATMKRADEAYAKMARSGAHPMSELKRVPWKEPQFTDCDFMPLTGHSQQHAPTCRHHSATEACICGLPLYDGHIEALRVGDTPPRGEQ